MNDASIDNLDMVDPIKYSELLNSAAETVGDTDLGSSFVQGIIDRMFEIAIGKGHSNKDTRQVVGLAAPQIGIKKRIILIDTTANGARQEQNLIAVINPTISDRSTDLVDGREGCWSCGNICGNVQRNREVRLSGKNRPTRSRPPRRNTVPRPYTKRPARKIAPGGARSIQ